MAADDLDGLAAAHDFASCLPELIGYEKDGDSGRTS
jgi:hypothetical protein